MTAYREARSRLEVDLVAHAPLEQELVLLQGEHLVRSVEHRW